MQPAASDARRPPLPICRRQLGARCSMGVLHCGIDLTPFHDLGPPSLKGSSEVRRSLGIGPDDFVIGNVGRFVPQKNHGFLVKLAGGMRKA